MLRIGTLVIFFIGFTQTAWGLDPPDEGLDHQGSLLGGLMIESDDEDQILSWEQELGEFILHQSAKKSKEGNSKFFLENLFYKIHRKYLKNYQQYSSLNSLLKTGDYDCVSGATLYAYVLEGLGYEYTIYETAYHIYLLVKTGQGSVLLESTDAFHGFVTHPGMIDERIREYKSQGNRRYQGEIDLVQLAGLQYYNLAIDAYNQRNAGQALKLLQKGKAIYPSSRLLDFNELIKATLGISARGGE